MALLLANIVACDFQLGNFGASIGPDAPSYTITLHQGGGVFAEEQVEFDDAKDEAPLVVYYFNGRCEQCAVELGFLQSAAEENDGEVTMLAVDLGPATGEGGPDGAEALLAEAGATFPAGYTTDASVVASHGIDAIPTIAFYGDDGHYRTKITGGLSPTRLEEALQDIQ